jgi:hypothetical protein
VFSRIGQAMYQNAQASQAAAGAEAGSGDGGEAAAEPEDDEVVEGEIVEEGGA